MEFKYKDFSCEVDIFRNEADLVVRFYNKEKEQTEERIINLVIVDPGYGYICLKFKGQDAGLLSGFFDEKFFTEELVQAAIEFVESLAPESNSRFIPYHVDRVKLTSYVEYNGEY